MSNNETGSGCAGHVFGMILGLYFGFGIMYGEYSAWEDMGIVSLISPATHLYAFWCGISWPMYLFSDKEAKAVLQPMPKNTNVLTTGQEGVSVYMLYDRGKLGLGMWEECKTPSPEEYQYFTQYTVHAGMAGACPIRTGFVNGERVAFVTCSSNLECETGRLSLIAEIESGQVSGFGSAITHLGKTKIASGN